MSAFQRPFADLQVLAKRVLEDDNFEVDLEIFSRFAEEIRHWILSNFDEPAIRRRAMHPPVIDTPGQRRASFLESLKGAAGIGMYRRHQEREKIRQQVRETARHYADIYKLIRQELE